MGRFRFRPWLVGLGIAGLIAAGLVATLLLTRHARYAACPDAIPWEIARDHTGEFLEIRGEVVRGFTDDETGTVVLDLGRAYPDPERVSVVVVDPAGSGFADDLADRYLERVVCVRGTVGEFEGAASVVVSDPSDIWRD